MTDLPPTLYCANHPQTETTLRCNRCEKPICTKCAVLTPTGYRCKECVKSQQKTFDTAQLIDYPLAFIVAGGLAFLGSLFIPRWFLLAVGMIVGCLPGLISTLQFAGIGIESNLVSGVYNYLPLLSYGIYVVLATSTAFYRLAGINLRA
jgi:hypothetical protein